MDHDKATIPISQAATALEDVASFLYPTKTPGRWRAALILSRIATAEEYRATCEPWRALFDCAAESCNPAQIWYLPRKGVIANWRGAPIEPSPVSTVDHSPEPERLSTDAPHRPGALEVFRLRNGWHIRNEAKAPSAVSAQWWAELRAKSRSEIDLALVHEAAKAGLTNAEIAQVLRERGTLSHTVKGETVIRDYHISRAIAAVRLGDSREWRRIAL